MKQPKNIFLVGPMGAGKSAVGRQLARTLHLTFVDSDDEIESKIIEIWQKRKDRYSELRLANKNDQSKDKVEMYYIGG